MRHVILLIMNADNYRTPGQLIKAQIDNRGWTQRTLAIILGFNETRINKIISGKHPVTAEVAILFGEIFDIPEETFLDLQKKYDLAKAKIVALPDPGRSKRAILFGGLPISEMIRRNWLEVDDIREVNAVETALMSFFGVDSIDEIEILPHATKKTDINTPVTPAQLAWFYRVKKISEDMLVPKYSSGALRNALTKLKGLLSSPHLARKVPRILMECGIRFVIVESLSSAKIDGVCFWLNENSPIIGMTLRYDRIDNFWFVLRHEIEHVLRKHGRDEVMLDFELEGEKAGSGEGILAEERIANEAAVDFCVPRKKLDSFIARKAPFFRELDMLGLSRTLNIHPGLIAGQIQHRTGRYNLFRKHLVKIRSVVLPNAFADGWGNAMPLDE